MLLEYIAKTAHQVNKAYCESIGDFSQKDWDNTPQNIKNSAISGVEYHLGNPDTTPEKSHEEWCKFKLADGWEYGDTKDLENKTHPCLIDYDQLPIEQRTKDYLFKAVVDSLRNV